jgi:hypothetical protein
MIENWARRLSDEFEWPELPPGVEDRDADIWESLIAVANMAGGDWLARARAAAVALVAASKEAEPTLGVRLLSDLRIVFGDAEQMTTAAILGALREMAEAPWNDIKGRPLDDRRLAGRLRQYGIKPRVVRIGGATPRGYRREDFVDAWERYLPPIAAGRATSATSETIEINQPDFVADDVALVADSSWAVADRRQENTRKINPVADVAFVVDLPGNGGARCAQCNGAFDGTERVHTLGGREVWLHLECQPFWVEGDGWGVRRIQTNNQ